VYATLGRLAQDGKVIAGEAEPGGGPDRKRYVIREQGATEVETWLAEPVEPEPHLQTVLFVKVVLALMLGRNAEKYLDTQRAAAARSSQTRRCAPVGVSRMRRRLGRGGAACRG
jgi:DNA-binding PadR family transcriptional regulator